jgi:hypothetical protein
LQHRADYLLEGFKGTKVERATCMKTNLLISKHKLSLSLTMGSYDEKEIPSHTTLRIQGREEMQEIKLNSLKSIELAVFRKESDRITIQPRKE